MTTLRQMIGLEAELWAKRQLGNVMKRPKTEDDSRWHDGTIMGTTVEIKHLMEGHRWVHVEAQRLADVTLVIVGGQHPGDSRPKFRFLGYATREMMERGGWNVHRETGLERPCWVLSADDLIAWS